MNAGGRQALVLGGLAAAGLVVGGLAARAGWNCGSGTMDAVERVRRDGAAADVPPPQAERGNARRKERATAEPGAGEKMKAVDVATARDLIRSRMRGRLEFGSLGSELGGALEWLGATEEQKQKVAALADGARERVLAAEREAAKLVPEDAAAPRVGVKNKTAAPGAVVALDLRGAADEAAAAEKGLLAGLREVMGPGTGEALAQAVNWQEQLQGPYRAAQVTLEVVQGEDDLWAYMGCDGHLRAEQVVLVDEKLPEDGPLPAERVFGERWRPLLKGVEILRQE